MPNIVTQLEQVAAEIGAAQQRGLTQTDPELQELWARRRLLVTRARAQRYTYREIGERLGGISRERVTQLAREAER